MKNKESQKQVGLGISKIRELEFSLTQMEEIKEAKYILGYQSEYDVEKNSFEIQIVADLIPIESDFKLLHIRVANGFVIENLVSFWSKESNMINIPEVLFITMLSMSITHTRALLAKNTSGTIFEKFLIPIVNPAEMASQMNILKSKK
jgi:hypothetical protein